MRRLLLFFIVAICLALSAAVSAQTTAPDTSPQDAPQSKAPDDTASKNDLDVEAALQKAIAGAANDRAALVRNLKKYLQRFPDAPRKAGVYRALVEACQQLRDNACALDYAEQLVALHPDDSEMMLLAVSFLQKQGDEASLTRAVGYISRVLDRVEKSTPDEKPARSSQKEWKDQQDQFRVALYALRGQIEKSQRNYNDAVKDLQQSSLIRQNALAAEQLGEIFEIRNDLPHAIEQYTLAFVLSENSPGGKVDRREVRRQLGNVWRQAHGNEQGLGEEILAAYDRAETRTAGADTSFATNNHGVKDTFAFTLRNLNGTPLSLAPLKGKVVVLSFWATWCGPCRELEPLFAQIAKNYAGNSSLAFYAVDTDEDEAQVPEFVAREKWNVPVVFADGLDDFMSVDTLPTVIIFDRTGKITFRLNGFPAKGFSESLTTAIQDALNPGN